MILPGISAMRMSSSLTSNKICFPALQSEVHNHSLIPKLILCHTKSNKIYWAKMCSLVSDHCQRKSTFFTDITDMYNFHESDREINIIIQ